MPTDCYWGALRGKYGQVLGTVQTFVSIAFPKLAVFINVSHGICALSTC